MILVFDLDDTLYDELSFVKSGFSHVAAYLEQDCNIPLQDSFQYMISRLAVGRDNIFDATLNHFGCFSKKRLLQSVQVYRKHKPDISLFTQADACLERFRNYPIYIVTDGNKVVQSNKVAALGLQERVKFSFISHRYGLKNAKPSPYCFFKICKLENVQPSEVIYIGDNPKKDFVGIKPFGFKTLRVLTGQHSHLNMIDKYEAHYSIKSLDEMTEKFLEILQSNQSAKKGLCL